MIEITTKYYSINELSEDALKEAIKVTQNLIDETMDLDCSVQCFQEELHKLGFNDAKIYYDCGYSQGSGASFDCDSIDLLKLLETNFLDAFPTSEVKDFKTYFTDKERKQVSTWIKYLGDSYQFQINTNSYSNHYCHSRTRQIEVDGYFLKNDCNPRRGTDKLLDLIHENLELFRRDLCYYIYKSLCSEIEYYWKDENVIQEAKERNLIFTENGSEYLYGELYNG